jgi:signal transduction histidine kinase
MINDLAMLSRAERGKEALEITQFNVGELLNIIVNDYRSQAAAKGLSLNIRIDPKLSMLNTSQLYVREILQNFITNSLKYTERGSITLSAAPADSGVVFTIADTGIGISQAEQKKLFSKFFRSDDSRVKKEHGTGLGLYVTAKLIKLLGGRLDIQSELNRGTSFQVYIPTQT